MHNLSRLTGALGVASLALFGLTSSAYAQTTVPFFFDNTFDSTVTPPVVGSGSATFTTDPGNGTFAFADLGSVTMSYTIGAETWTEADIATDTANVQVVLSSSIDGRRLQWSDIGPDGGGPFGGSLDLVNGNGVGLSFEPSGFGQGLNLYFSTNGFSGTYTNVVSGGSAAPEPGTFALLGAGLGMVGFVVARRKA